MRGLRIVWPAAKQIKLEEFELGTPGINEVLLATDYTVVSAGTEKAWLGGEPNTSNVFPQYPGYSAAGRVIEVGPGVSEFKPGDRIVAYHSPHSSHAIKNVADLVKIEDNAVRSEEAAFTIIAAMSLHGVRKASLELGESVLVIGQGLLGLLATQLAKIDGAQPVIAADFSPARLSLAQTLGADAALNPAGAEFKERFQAAAAGRGVNAVIEVTGAPAAMNLALECVAREGRVVALGCTRHPVDGIDFYRHLHHPGVSIIGAHNMARPKHDTTPGHWTMRDDLRVLLRLLAAGRLRVGPIISRLATPQQAPEVYNNLLETNDAPLGAVFDWTKTR